MWTLHCGLSSCIESNLNNLTQSSQSSNNAVEGGFWFSLKNLLGIVKSAYLTRAKCECCEFLFFCSKINVHFYNKLLKLQNQIELKLTLNVNILLRLL